MALERLSASLDVKRYQRPVEVNKYVSTPEQLLALRLAASLDDREHKRLYLHWAKHLQAGLLEEALSFALDAHAQNKGALFAWKLKQLRQQWLAEGKNPQRKVVKRTGKKKPLTIGEQQGLFF